jgi:integrase
MATIENRSVYVVTVLKREDLTKTFAYTRLKEVKAYIAELKAAGYQPKLSRTDDKFAIRVRDLGHRHQCLYATSLEKATQIQKRIESERSAKYFVDYALGYSFTFGDLLTRYLLEEAPRHKGYEVEGYVINAILSSSGLPRVDIAQAYADHPNPHPSLASKAFRKPTGKSTRKASPKACFVRMAFADILPKHIKAYADERCKSVSGATVDRELDLISAVCRMAIDTWRIPVIKSPMDGLKRPEYFNERDRRLKDGEEKRLLDAAYNEDAQKSIEHRLEELMPTERAESKLVALKYLRKDIIKAARIKHLPQAEASYTHIPWMEAFVQFQLMTGARLSETKSLTWENIDFIEKTAFIPETKNGRSRKLALRTHVIELLRQLPRNGEKVFPISLDALKKAWARICLAAGLVGTEELHVHDLRHEAISRVADAGGRGSGNFTLLDLQAFSGHRDMRMLLRYTHLCIPSLAKKLDEAFADTKQVVVHRGQRRLKKGAQLNMKLLTNAPPAAPQELGEVDKPEHATSNVVPFRRRLAA